MGVATQDPKRSRALDVPDKTKRVYRYQHAVVTEAQRPHDHQSRTVAGPA